MRIGYTNYYTITKHLFSRDTETRSIRPVVTHGYVLSMYNKKQHEATRVVNELRQHGIWGQFKYFIEEDLELPHILILHPTSVQRLEEEFKKQGIALPEDRFDKKTDWDDVIDFEESKRPSTLWQRIHREFIAR